MIKIKRLHGAARVIGVFIVLGVVGLYVVVAVKAALYVVDNWYEGANVR